MSTKRHARSRRTRHAAFLTASGVASALAAYGCTELEKLDENVCGNRVVEEANGEDCDGEEGAHTCGKANTPNACRFVCEDGAACPEGYGCGADSVCRRPKGDFEPFVTKSTATTLDLTVGDTNANGCQEIVHTTVHGTFVTGFDSLRAGFCTASSQLFPSHAGSMQDPLTASPIVTELSGNAQPELVLTGAGPLNPGIYVNSSDATGNAGLVAVLYPTEELPEPGVRMLKVRVPGADGARDAVLMFLGEKLGEPGPLSNECPMPDGGTMMMPDGGTMMPDGGLPPPDGGLPPPDGGLPPPDGGLPPPDGGLPPPPPAPPTSGTVRVALIDRPEQKAVELTAALAGGGLGSIVALAAAPTLDANGCQQIVLGRGGATKVEVYRLCGPSMPGMGQMGQGFTFEHQTDVALDNGAKLRYRNASLVFAYLDANVVSLVLNADDCNIHAAAKDATGGFSSAPGALDNRTGILQNLDPKQLAQLIDPKGVLLAGEFDSAHAGDEIAGAVCPEGAAFVSDVCPAVTRGCEALFEDIDRDGLKDIVTTQGQQVGLIVGRAYTGGMGFHISMLDTECPPHDLAIGDFDDDGVNDIAFFDQTVVAGGVTGSPVVKIAYGRPYQAPESPRVAGLIDHAVGLVSGKFTPTTPQDTVAPTKLFAAQNVFAKDGSGETITTTALGMLAGSSERETLAPFYLPKLGSGMNENTLANLEILAVAKGAFTAAGPALAMIAREAGKPLELWRVRFDAQRGTLIAERSEGANEISCNGCVLTAVNADGTGLEELLVFDEGTLTVYGAGDDGFEKRGSAAMKHRFVSIEGTMMPPTRYVPRPLVTDLDGAHDDVILRDEKGVLVAFWGKGDGTFEEAELFEAGTCAGKCAVTRIREGASAPKRLLLVGPDVLDFYELSGRKPVRIDVTLPLAAPGKGTDFVAAAAADFDGDGVDDLAIMTSGSSIHVFRGKPVNQ